MDSGRSRPRHRFPRRPHRFGALVLLVGASLAVSAPAVAETPHPTADDMVVIDGEQWSWPLASPFHVAEPYAQPAHDYAPGHRGIDIAPLGASTVLAPDAGIVAFRGTVVDRGVLTIDHGGGLVSTLEPVTSSLSTGDRVERGGKVGELAVGGHATPGTVHLGARLNGTYINPMLLLGGVPRAILLPCC